MASDMAVELLVGHRLRGASESSYLRWWTMTTQDGSRDARSASRSALHSAQRTRFPSTYVSPSSRFRFAPMTERPVPPWVFRAATDQIWRQANDVHFLEVTTLMTPIFWCWKIRLRSSARSTRRTTPAFEPTDPEHVVREWNWPPRLVPGIASLCKRDGNCGGQYVSTVGLVG
jgi:hypothetical protein